MHFWSEGCVLWQILNIPTKIGEDWSSSEEMATLFRNSRCRRQPSCIINFRLNRQYEKETRGLLLLIRNPTFVRLSWRLRVLYSRGLYCWSDFRCKSGKSKNGSKFWCFSGLRPLKTEFEGFKLRRGTCAKQNTSLELLNERIGPELRPVGEMRKRKKGITSHKTVAFHQCVAAPPCQLISTKFGVFLGLTNVITYTKNGLNYPLVFPGRQVEKRRPI